MNLFEAIFSRKGAREFENTPVDDRYIGVILHSATYAPSAGELQEWEFIVVKDEKIKKDLADAALKQRSIAEAPVDIVVCADLRKVSLRFEERGEFLYALQDTGASVGYMLLAATALGLSADWIRAFDEESVKDSLNLPDNLRPVGIIPIGYAKEKTKIKSRLLFERITSLDRYDNKYEIKFKPIVTALEEAIAEVKKRRKIPKKTDFIGFLKRLIK